MQIDLLVLASKVTVSEGDRERRVRILGQMLARDAACRDGGVQIPEGGVRLRAVNRRDGSGLSGSRGCRVPGSGGSDGLGRRVPAIRKRVGASGEQGDDRCNGYPEPPRASYGMW